MRSSVAKLCHGPFHIIWIRIYKHQQYKSWSISLSFRSHNWLLYLSSADRNRFRVFKAVLKNGADALLIAHGIAHFMTFGNESSHCNHIFVNYFANIWNSTHQLNSSDLSQLEVNLKWVCTTVSVIKSFIFLEIWHIFFGMWIDNLRLQHKLPNHSIWTFDRSPDLLQTRPKIRTIAIISQLIGDVRMLRLSEVLLRSELLTLTLPAIRISLYLHVIRLVPVDRLDV